MQQLGQILMVLNERIAKLEHVVNDVIIESWREAADEELKLEQEKQAAEAKKAQLEAFMANYPEVAQLSGPLKALYGDDYDVYGDLFEAMQGHIGDEGFDERAYVEGQLKDVNARIGNLQTGNYGEEAVPEEVIDEEQLARELAAVS